MAEIYRFPGAGAPAPGRRDSIDTANAWVTAAGMPMTDTAVRAWLDRIGVPVPVGIRTIMRDVLGWVIRAGDAGLAAGATPVIPGPPAVPADLDGIGDRYTAYAEAVVAGDGPLIRLLAQACADDIPAMQQELIRVEALRRELAEELDRIRGGA